MGKIYRGFVFFIYFMFSLNVLSMAQNVVVKGGGVVVDSMTFLVIQGNLTVKPEVSDGIINLDGTILLSGDITNETNEVIFTNQELHPNGWVVMFNPTTIQKIAGITPIAFENLSLSGAEKLLENNNSSTNGMIRLGAIFNLNKRNFILNNEDLAALEYSHGYLYAETNPVEGIGSFQWNISNNLGIFKVPFGSGMVDTSDIAIDFRPISGASSNGGILFSTYPTGNNNTPYPDLVNTLAPYSSALTVDRFWILDADSYSNKPLSSFVLRYTTADAEHGNSIVKDKLKPISYQFSDFQWPEYPIFDNDIITNSMSVLNVNSMSFVKNWTLTSDDAAIDVFFPNAFTPDLNGDNEVFKPVMGFVPKHYELYVYNRWGNLIFTSNSPTFGWNGIYQNNECQIGAYAWKAIIVKPNGKESQYIGHVSIIK